MLHLTIGSTILLFALIPEFIAFVISIRGFIFKKYPHFLYMALTWLFLFIGNLLLTYSYLTTDTTLYRYAIIANAPLTFSIMLLVDSISRKNVDPIKLLFTTFVSTCVVIFAFDSNAVILNKSAIGEIAPALHGRFDIAGSLLFLLSGAFWVYYMAKIFLNAPKTLKKDAFINFMGAVIAGPGSTLAFASGFVWYFPGTDYVCIGVGALTCAYAFSKQPKLGYILSFKVYGLIAINTGSGISLFNYEWDKNQPFDNQLFSATLFSISSILNESLNKGSINEIDFEQGTLIINRIPDYPVFFVLVATETRPILRHALMMFSKEFASKFPQEKIIDNPVMAIFSQANEILKETFPFIVNYSEKV